MKNDPFPLILAFLIASILTAWFNIAPFRRQ